MKVVVQRSLSSSVSIDDKIVGKIEHGFVILVGYTNGDSEEKNDYIIKKLINLRIFEDENHLMNKSILDVGGEVLSISQFTLYADCKKGNRPGFSEALNPKDASYLYDDFNKKLSNYVHVATGMFGEDMKVNIINDGPVTIILER